MTKKKKPEDLKKTGRPLEWTPEKLEELRQEMLEFVAKDGVWHLSAFNIHKGMSGGWLHEIAASHPIFSEHIQEANKIIGNKMLNQSMTKNPNQWVIRTFMPKMLGIREQLNKEKAEHEKQIAQATAEGKIAAIEKSFENKGEIIEYLNLQKQILDDDK